MKCLTISRVRFPFYWHLSWFHTSWKYRLSKWSLWKSLDHDLHLHFQWLIWLYPHTRRWWPQEVETIFSLASLAIRLGGGGGGGGFGGGGGGFGVVVGGGLGSGGFGRLVGGGVVVDLVGVARLVDPPGAVEHGAAHVAGRLESGRRASRRPAADAAAIAAAAADAADAADAAGAAGAVGAADASARHRVAPPAFPRRRRRQPETRAPLQAQSNSDARWRRLRPTLHQGKSTR